MGSSVRTKPPIAIIAPHPGDGGGVLSSLKIVYEFCERYFQPKVYCLSFYPDVAMSLSQLRFSSTSIEREYEGMKCVEIGAVLARSEPSLYWFTYNIWKKYLSEYEYVFVTGGTPHIAHPAVLLNKKFVFWLASTYAHDREHRLKKASLSEKIIQKIADPVLQYSEKQILAQTTVLLPISLYTQNLCTQVLGKSRELMKICPVPVEIKLQEIKETGPRIHLLAVGRFTDPRKNLSMLLAVCEKLCQNDDMVFCDIVGRFPEEDPLVLDVQKRFAGRIIFHGFVSQQKLDELYKKAFVFVITSDQEGLGIAGLDALSWGVPVVSTRCGGVLDYVIPGMTGFLVNLNEVEEMVDRVEQLKKDRVKHAFYARGALTLVNALFSKKTVFTRFQWALSRAYPELENHFIAIDEQKEGEHETFGSGAHVPFINQ
ncbi:glycosyltransferase family 4 protein [Candidatus Dependentiae bacterium]|nr:glycosyltransferase family 4 protein [Candidatus Dependentiae bacterium]